MFFPPSIHWRAWLLVSTILAADPVRAAPAIQLRAVDMLTLIGGEQILGILAAAPIGAGQRPIESEGIITIYASRNWLRERQPKFYRKLTNNDGERRRQALQQYRERLTDWLGRRPEPKLLNDFLRRSLRDVEARLPAGEKDGETSESSQLMIIEVPAKQVRRFYVQPPAARRLLALAWEARIDGVEELAANKLSERLKEQGVDIEHGEPDLSDRFDVVPLTPLQWAAKVALIEFEILGKPRFQGTGSMLIEDDDQGARPPPDLVGGLLQDQLGDALDGLLNPQPDGGRPKGDSKQQAAIEKALASSAERKASGVRVTYLDQSLADRRVTVTDSFHALMPDGSWRVLWRQPVTVTTDGGEDDGANELAADPQVAEIMKTLQGLGLDANQELFKSALRFGGATQKAMSDAEREFAAFLRGHTRRLIGPPVPVPDEEISR